MTGHSAGVFGSALSSDSVSDHGTRSRNVSPTAGLAGSCATVRMSPRPTTIASMSSARFFIAVWYGVVARLSFSSG